MCDQRAAHVIILAILFKTVGDKGNTLEDHRKDCNKSQGKNL